MRSGTRSAVDAHLLEARAFEDAAHALRVGEAEHAGRVRRLRRGHLDVRGGSGHGDRDPGILARVAASTRTRAGLRAAGRCGGSRRRARGRRRTSRRSASAPRRSRFRGSADWRRRAGSRAARAPPPARAPRPARASGARHRPPARGPSGPRPGPASGPSRHSRNRRRARARPDGSRVPRAPGSRGGRSGRRAVPGSSPRRARPPRSSTAAARRWIRSWAQASPVGARREPARGRAAQWHIGRGASARRHGSPGRIRTFIHRFRVCCPAVRRPGIRTAIGGVRCRRTRLFRRYRDAPSTQHGAASIVARAACRRVVVRSRPRTTSVSKIPGDAEDPVTATRTGWASFPSFRSRGPSQTR